MRIKRSRTLVSVALYITVFEGKLFFFRWVRRPDTSRRPRSRSGCSRHRNGRVPLFYFRGRCRSFASVRQISVISIRSQIELRLLYAPSIAERRRRWGHNYTYTYTCVCVMPLKFALTKKHPVSGLVCKGFHVSFQPVRS